jgi:hypothetical protein
VVSWGWGEDRGDRQTRDRQKTDSDSDKERQRQRERERERKMIGPEEVLLTAHLPKDERRIDPPAWSALSDR